MALLKTLLGRISPHYKHKVDRQEWTLLVNSLINSLPEQFNELKIQRRRTTLFHLSDWASFPGFKFMSIGYPGTTLTDFKRRGQNYMISGLNIYSKNKNAPVDVEFLIHDNCLAGIRIVNSNYNLEEFDLKRIESNNVQTTPVEFPPSDVDLFYEGLDDSLKSKLASNDIFDIDFNNRTYFAFYDLEDGNYLATDKNLNVYSLVHDARPMVKKLKYSLPDIVQDIQANKFDKVKHLEDRYKTSS